MSTAAHLQLTHSSTVTPDQIDELGHMNVRWYGHNALEATRSFAHKLGLPNAATVDSALVSTYTRHHNEQLVGSHLDVSSGVLDSPSGQMRMYHELSNRATGALAATFVHQIDSDVSHSEVQTSTIELPDHGRPRSLRLDTDAFARVPTLEDVQRLGLAVRLPRTVTTEDSMGADHVPPWLMNNLIWSGDRPEGEEGWIKTGPNGERIAFATMESRMWIGELTPVGTRIQSFGAMIDLGEKTSHGMSWAFDLGTGQILAVFEVLNLCFNLGTRQSMVLPDAIRSSEEQRLHPHLGMTATR